ATRDVPAHAGGVTGNSDILTWPRQFAVNEENGMSPKSPPSPRRGLFASQRFTLNSSTSGVLKLAGVKRAGASATPGCLKPKTAAPWKGARSPRHPFRVADS